MRLPADATIELAPDDRTILARLAYADPGRTVHMLDVTTVAPDGGSIVSAFFSGGDAERTRYTLTEMRIESDADWSMTFVTEGRDGDDPAAVRIVRSLSDGVLTSRQETRPLADAGQAWTLRNELRLSRAATDPEALLGAWSVDLRPTPEAEAYLQPMVVESVDGNRITGRFYGTEMESGRLNLDWRAVRFSFVTRDGSGAYYTTGVLRDGRLQGTTHSIGRDFLAVWSAPCGREAGRGPSSYSVASTAPR